MLARNTGANLGHPRTRIHQREHGAGELPAREMVGTMSKKHLDLKPHRIDEYRWWYEDNKGIDVYFEATGPGIQGVQIPWSAIRAALTRKDKK